MLSPSVQWLTHFIAGHRFNPPVVGRFHMPQGTTLPRSFFPKCCFFVHKNVSKIHNPCRDAKMTRLSNSHFTFTMHWGRKWHFQCSCSRIPGRGQVSCPGHIDRHDWATCAIPTVIRSGANSYQIPDSSVAKESRPARWPCPIPEPKIPWDSAGYTSTLALVLSWAECSHAGAGFDPGWEDTRRSGTAITRVPVREFGRSHSLCSLK